MTTYKFGDVVIVPFPFTDGITSKKRPAIVISSDSYNRSKPDIILIAVTSQVNIDLGWVVYSENQQIRSSFALQSRSNISYLFYHRCVGFPSSTQPTGAIN